MNNENFEDNVNTVEAVLFSSGRFMSVSEISRICRLKQEIVLKALEKLEERYSKTNTALTLIKQNDTWKLTVREKYVEPVRKIVPHTELTKSVLETLAVIAWKAPVLQSDIIKIRTNKAYDHIDYLAETGWIVKEKHGRTYLLRLTKKFFKYFEIEGKENIKELLDKITAKKQGVEVYNEENQKASGEEENSEEEKGKIENINEENKVDENNKEEGLVEEEPQEKIAVEGNVENSSKEEKTEEQITHDYNAESEKLEEKEVGESVEGREEQTEEQRIEETDNKAPNEQNNENNENNSETENEREQEKEQEQKEQE